MKNKRMSILNLVGASDLFGGAAVAVPWYLAGGVSAENCTIAFQAIGVSSVDDTYKNLVTGNTELASNVYKTWATETGWYNDQSAGIYNLDNDFSGIDGLANSSVSWIAKINPSITSSIISPFRFRYSVGNVVLRFEATTGNVIFENHNSYTYESAGTDAIYACAGTKCYIDGSEVGSLSAGTYGTGTTYGINCEQSGANRFNGYFSAFALYKTGLSQEQVAAVGTAMNAL